MTRFEGLLSVGGDAFFLLAALLPKQRPPLVGLYNRWERRSGTLAGLSSEVPLTKDLSLCGQRVRLASVSLNDLPIGTAGQS